MKIAIIGTGYVGLVAGASLAETGHEVVCVDKDSSRIRALRRGGTPFYEPGLGELVRRNRLERRLTFTSRVPPAVRGAAVVFIAVGTPESPDGTADLRQVLRVAGQIGRAMDGQKIVVCKSTVPVGTSEKIRQAIGRETRFPFTVVSNPEFLKQGAAVEDFMKPDRVVIGTDDPAAARMVADLYGPFTRSGAPILVMDCASAELAKYAANALLATRISFINEIANVCELVGADIDQVRRAIASDRRIGPSFLFPGVGYGGSCFPKDVRAMIRFAADRHYDCRLLLAADVVNALQKTRLFQDIEQHFGDLHGRTVAVWGLSFKPKTDDIRSAPSIPLIQSLLKAGAAVQAYDPAAIPAARSVFGELVRFTATAYEALLRADAVAIVTEWSEFRRPDFSRMRALMRSPVVFDGRNVFTPDEMQGQGFVYYSIGRPRPAPGRSGAIALVSPRLREAASRDAR
jgi:UDPglucose 6-dehydrogenase